MNQESGEHIKNIGVVQCNTMLCLFIVLFSLPHNCPHVGCIYQRGWKPPRQSQRFTVGSLSTSQFQNGNSWEFSQRQNILQKHAFLRGMHLARKGLGNMWCDMFQPNSPKSPVTKSLVTTLFCKSQISFPNFSHMIFRTDHPLFFLKHFPHAHIKALPQSNSVSFYDMQMSLWPCPHMRHTKHVEFAVILRF